MCYRNKLFIIIIIIIIIMRLFNNIIIPRARMGSESIAEWAIDSEAIQARGIFVLVKSN